MARILATADIGSNTAHLLIARTDGNSVVRLDNRNDWLALGEVVARMGQVPPAYVSRIVSTLKKFKSTASKALAEELLVFATEAMRRASNHKEVLTTIREKTGIKVKLITHQEEAYYGLRGALLDASNKDNVALLEVGGGSAQIALCNAEGIREEISLPIGTGRLTVEAGLTNPCPGSALKKAEEIILEALNQCKFEIAGSSVVASGGVGRGIWRALHPDGEQKLILDEIDYLYSCVQRLPVEVIVNRFGVKPRRAETLVPGTLVYRTVMRHLGIQELYVSEFGVREGALLEVAQGKLKAQVI